MKSSTRRATDNNPTARHDPHAPRLPLEYAPAKVLRHGLRDAHVWPLVSHGKRADGTHGPTFRVPACNAWDYAELELRAANSWPAMVFDCDGRDGTARLVEARMAGRVCGANWTVTRHSSGGSHVAYCLARPVHRGEGARTAPLRRYARIAEYYAQALGADRGYAGVLTHNPMAAAHGPGFKTGWGRHDPYTLDELAEVIPLGWRMPTKSAAISTEAGRNCYLFRAAMRQSGKPANWGRDVTALVVAMNDALPLPLGHAEVVGIARSVNRYQRDNLATGQTQRRFAFIQSSRGKRSGKARRLATAGRDAEIVAAVERGESMRAVARSYGLTEGAVRHIVARGCVMNQNR